MAIEIISIDERKSIKETARHVFKKGPREIRSRKRVRILRLLFLLLVLVLAAIIALLSSSYLEYSKIVDARLASGYLTSRAGIYAAPRKLRVGQLLSREDLVKLLRRAGYVETNASDVWSGSFVSRDNSVEIRPRQSRTNAKQVVRLTFNDKHRIAELTSDGATIESYTLEPELLTNDVSMKTGSRSTLSFSEIPNQLVQAISAIEDQRFFEHSGLDVFGIARAIMRNASDEAIGQGGSTITQQLVKNTYLSPERTFRRKYAEAMLAFTLERRLSKEDIFALYCNEIYLGQRGGIGVRGIKQAANIYFGKELKDLTLAESATIAGMIQGPNRYSPHRHPESSVARRNIVIGAMLRQGVIAAGDASVALSKKLAVAPLSTDGHAIAPYFIDYVNRVVETKLTSANHADEREARIYTTIDLDLQKLAEDAIRRQLDDLDKLYPNIQEKPQAALVALDPKTGHVLAMVGGRGYQESQLNRATDALRQPGSVFKPLVYAAALETGTSPVSMFTDAPQEFVYDRNAKYRPANYGGGYSMRDVTMRTALVKSLNVVTVDIAMRTGLKRVARYAEDFGLPRPEPFPSLALGTTEATPLTVAGAYTVFANAGVRVEPTVVTRLTVSSGANLVDETPRTRDVIDPATAYMITDMLSDVIDHGTARAARGSIKQTAVAGKTGTSRDGWFVGYTPNLVVAVWIGFDDNKQLGVTGAKAALPAWTEFVKGAVELRPDLGGESFDLPEGIVNVEIDPQTGGRASLSCPQRESIAITTALSPNVECFLHVDASAFASLEYGEEYKSQSLSPPVASSVPNREAKSLSPNKPSIRDSSAQTSWRSTRVVTDNGGRSALVNDMRVESQR
jgi:penicillin-binding protein 1B